MTNPFDQIFKERRAPTGFVLLRSNRLAVGHFSTEAVEAAVCGVHPPTGWDEKTEDIPKRVRVCCKCIRIAIKLIRIEEERKEAK